MGDAVEESIKWLDANQEKEKEEYEATQKELEGVCNPIMQKMYAGAGGAGGMPGGMPGGIQVVCQVVCQAVCQVVCQAACQAVQAQHRTPMTKGPRSKKSTNSPASKLNRPRPLVVVNSIFYFLQEVMKHVLICFYF